MMTKIDGVLRPVDLELQESASLDLEATPAMDPDSMSASLIDFTQWVSCFTLNNADDEFQLYTWFWNGTPRTSGSSAEQTDGVTSTSGTGTRAAGKQH